MPRKARIDAPGALHHIICRGIEGRKIFRDDADRENFADRLGIILNETSTPCYAWALMPNHFHLLLRTGNAPLATIMRRLLTGYAVSFNRRYRRHGHLFQNRYKSILCQQDPYLLELVRYIHLNPLRAKIVTTLPQLDRYPYCGHSRLMGRVENNWQAVDEVLRLYATKAILARHRYRAFVEKGIALGKRPELTGGGLIRSAGGWAALKDLRQSREHFKSDERILGESDFVKSVLEEQNEMLEQRYRLQEQGYDFEKILGRVADLFEMQIEQIRQPSKEPKRVCARSLVCYWAVRHLAINGTTVGRDLGLTQSAVSKAVRRGEKEALDKNLSLEMKTNS
jgi:REP element-mobilizing transposase RayT